MQTIFKIVKFQKENESFIKIGYDEFIITYLKGLKINQLRIVVNGYLTKETIDLMSFKSGYKNRILSAIKEYKQNYINCKNFVTKKISINYMKQFYSKKIVRNVEIYLIPINKEESRDKLTEFNLI
jgi:hypothetical protein